MTRCDLCASCVLPGNSSECPPPGNAADDTVCLDLGKCKDGKCVPFCEREQHLESCACNGEHMSVLRPCRREDDLCSQSPPFEGPAGATAGWTVARTRAGEAWSVRTLWIQILACL